MDDQINRVHRWNWNRRADDKFFDTASGYSMPDECAMGDTFGDSLKQLNKIVERIQPENPSPAVILARQKKETLQKRPHIADSSDGCNFSFSYKQQLEYNCNSERIDACEPVTRKPLKASHDVQSVKLDRASDSLNDSAYETFYGEGSNDNGESAVPGTKESVKISNSDRSAVVDFKSCSDSQIEKEAKFSSFVSQDANSCSKSVDSSCSEQKLSGLQPQKGSYRKRHISSAELYSSTKFPKTNAAETDLEKVDSKAELNHVLVKKEVKVNQDLDDGVDVANVAFLSRGESSADVKSVDSIHSVEWANKNKKNDEEFSAHDADSSVQISPPKVLSEKSHSIVRCFPQKEKAVSSATDDEEMSPMSKDMVGITSDENSKSFTCPHCVYSAPKKGQVRKHMSVHGIFLCAHCEYACERAELLEEHRRVHHPGLCGRRLCKKCRILFPSTELDLHESQCSGEKQRWACPECGKEFKFLSVMKAHAHKWHPQDINSSLPTSSSAASAVVHSSSSVSERELNSEVSNEDVAKVETSTDHSVVVSSKSSNLEKVYQCEDCGKTFKTKWTLSNHAMMAHGANTPFCCDIDGCNGTPFRSDKELNSHREVVHQLSPRKYNCSHPGCSMQFAKYGHFKRHQSTHSAAVQIPVNDSTPSSTELAFRCEWPACGKAFSHQEYLRIHCRQHTDEKPYRCSHCEASYRQKSGLKYHLEKIHGEKTVGRCGRKRKVVTEGDEVSEVNSITSSSLKHVKPVSKGKQQGEASQKGRVSSVESASIGGYDLKQKIRDNVTAMQKSKDQMLAKQQSTTVKEVRVNPSVADAADDIELSKTKCWPVRSNPENITWPPTAAPSECQDGDDGDLNSFGLGEDWMLDNDMAYARKESQHKMSDASTGSSSRLGHEHELAGSTSDTEPLDEDLCEELRKLTDVINSSDLSPQGIKCRATPCDSPMAAANSFANSLAINSMKLVPDSASTEDVACAAYRDDVPLHRGFSLPDHRVHNDQFDSVCSYSNRTDMPSRAMYVSRHQSLEGLSSINEEELYLPKTMMTAGGMSNGRPHVDLSGQCSNNVDYMPDEYYMRSDSASQSSCYTNGAGRYLSPRHHLPAVQLTSQSQRSLSNDGEIDSTRRSLEYDQADQPWPMANSSYWSVRTADSISSESGHSLGSNALAPGCSSTGPELIEQRCLQDDGCTVVRQDWPMGESEHQWPPHQDGILRSWPGHLQQSPEPVHPANHEYAPDAQSTYRWRMGRQGESAFTPSRVAAAGGISSSVGFDIVSRRTVSPGVESPYHRIGGGTCDMPNRLADSFNLYRRDGYSSSNPADNAWSGMCGGRPASTSSCGDSAMYDQFLSTREAVCKSSFPSDRRYLPGAAGESVAAILPARPVPDYGHNLPVDRRQANGAYGLGNSAGYGAPPMNSSIPWSPTGYSDDAECLRLLPGSAASSRHCVPAYQQQQHPMLYNVVPRYY